MNQNSDLLNVTILERQIEADGVISLVLAPLHAAALPLFDAGAHVDVHVAPGIIRQYSLCNNPSERSHYRIGILREEKSRGGSQAIHDAFREHQTIQIGHPRNNFKLTETARHTILAGGGIGITPLMAMAWRLHELGASFELHYCTRSIERTAFRAFVETSPFADKILLHLDNGSEDQRFHADRYLTDPQADKHIYVCGPGGFMNYVMAGAFRLGWRQDNVHVEYFSADVDLTGASFLLRTARTGLTLSVPAGKTIADVLLANGVDLPLSCEQGVCGTCLTNVLEGIPDHRDLYLSDQEKRENRQMTPCVSRSRSPILVLDI